MRLYINQQSKKHNLEIFINIVEIIHKSIIYRVPFNDMVMAYFIWLNVFMHIANPLYCYGRQESENQHWFLKSVFDMRV